MTDFAGVLSNFGEIDTYFSQIVAGRRYYVELEGADFGGDAGRSRSQRFSGGSFVVEDDDGGIGLNSRAVFRAVTSGQYVFSVSDFDGGTGSYVLRVNEDDFRSSAEGNGTAGFVGNRLPAQLGEINYSGDRDGFSTQLIAGLAYRITERGSQTLGAPQVSLVDQNDTLVASDSTSGGSSLSSFDYVPSSTGTYFVQAGAVADGIGTYSVSVGVGRGTNSSERIDGTTSSDNV